MGLTVAIERDRNLIRAAVAEGGVGGLTLRRLATFEVAEGLTPTGLADAVRAALPGVRWSRAELVGVAGGDHTRCRLLKLPRVPEGELPTIVRLQAEREFGAADGALAIDFVPIDPPEDAPADSPRPALAVGLSQQHVSEFSSLAEKLGATLKGVVARAASVASLAIRLRPDLATGAHLVVAPAGGFADLIVVEQSAPELFRSAKLRDDEDGGADIGGEVRRTSAMAAQQTGLRLESVVYCGISPGRKSAMQAVTLDIDAGLREAFGYEGDPAIGLAGVAGAALDAAAGRRGAVDFLHPRRPAVDHGPRRRQVVLGATAAVLLLGGLVLGAQRLWGLDAEVADYAAQTASVNQNLEKLKPYQARAAEVEAWLASDVNWLEELARLSGELRPKPLDAKDFPEESDAMLVQVVMAPPKEARQGGGLIELTVAARDEETLQAVEKRLRDSRHDVQPGSYREAPTGGDYRFTTNPTIVVAPVAEGDAP